MIKLFDKSLASSPPTHLFYLILYSKTEFPTIMAKESTRMPMSTAGITTYFEDYKSKIEFKPGHIIVFSVVVIIVIIVLHIWGSSFLGLV